MNKFVENDSGKWDLSLVSSNDNDSFVKNTLFIFKIKYKSETDMNALK